MLLYSFYMLWGEPGGLIGIREVDPPPLHQLDGQKNPIRQAPLVYVKNLDQNIITYLSL